jgi:hypothetical protein
MRFQEDRKTGQKEEKSGNLESVHHDLLAREDTAKERSVRLKKSERSRPWRCLDE